MASVELRESVEPMTDDPTAARNGGDPHVWLVPVNPINPALTARLQPEELMRAQELRNRDDRDRFVTARLALRALIGRCTGTPCDRVKLDRGPHGAPIAAGTDWNCSIAHSGRWAMIGLCRDQQIGVDIEAVRDVEDALLIAEHHLHALEQERIRSLRGRHRSIEFLRIWVRKEAVAKAAGVGLGAPLDNWHALRGAGDASRRPIEVPDWEMRRWLVFDVDIGDACVGAVATTARADKVKVRHACLAGLDGID